MVVHSTGSRELRLAALADELRADAANGLYAAGDPADRAAFEGVRAAAARLMSFVDVREAGELEGIFAADTAPRTPLLAVALLLHHQAGGLQFVREGDGHGAPWAFVAAHEDHETAVKRLTDTVLPGEEVLPVPHGVCDSIAAGLAMPHTYVLTYAVDTTFVDSGAFAVEVAGESAVDSVDALTRYIMGGAAHDVLEAAFTLDAAAREAVEAARRHAEARREAAGPRLRDRFARIADTCQTVLQGETDARRCQPVAFTGMDARTPTVAAQQLILDDADRIVLCPTDDGWALPGGPCEVGESSAGTAIRTAAELTAWDTTIAGLAGVFDQRLLAAPDEGGAAFVYIGRPTVPGAVAGDSDMRLVDPGDLDAIALRPGEHAKISGALHTAVE